MFPGFNRKKRSTISKGDFDRDGVSNRKDCEPLNFRKQDGICVECGRKDPSVNPNDFWEACKSCKNIAKQEAAENAYKEDHFGVSQDSYEGYFG